MNSMAVLRSTWSFQWSAFCQWTVSCLGLVNLLCVGYIKAENAWAGQIWQSYREKHSLQTKYGKTERIHQYCIAKKIVVWKGFSYVHGPLWKGSPRFIILVDLDMHIFWHSIESWAVWSFACVTYSKLEIIPLIVDSPYVRTDSKNNQS